MPRRASSTTCHCRRSSASCLRPRDVRRRVERKGVFASLRARWRLVRGRLSEKLKNARIRWHKRRGRTIPASLRPQHLAAHFFEATNNKILEDPRVKLFIEDGRIHLLTSKTRYDVVTLEPPEMHTAG